MSPLLTNDYRTGPSGELLVVDRRASRAAGENDLSRGPRGLSTARAALKVLSFLARHPEGVSAREVAGELGKSVSTAYDLLASLCQEGFARHEPGRGYRLCAETPVGIRAPDPSHSEALSQAANQLFGLTHRRSYLGRVEAGAIALSVCGKQGIPRVPGLGSRVGRGAHALAIGKVVLARLPEHSRRRYVERGMRAYTPSTITAAGPLMSELDSVRRNGFAISRGEFDAEYCCVAAPVLDARGRFLAVLGLSTLARTFEAEAQDLLGAVREVAAAAGSGFVPA